MLKYLVLNKNLLLFCLVVLLTVAGLVTGLEGRSTFVLVPLLDFIGCCLKICNKIKY